MNTFKKKYKQINKWEKFIRIVYKNSTEFVLLVFVIARIDTYKKI